MKKTLYIAAAVIAVMFAASCQKDDVQAAKKGMTLSAAVQEDSKATLDQDGTKYHFNWETGDAVYVYNPSSKYFEDEEDGGYYVPEYQFVNNGTTFVSEEAMPEAGNWVATYPEKRNDDINFGGQDGELESIAENYPLYGTATASATQTRLGFTMTPVCAVLKIENTEPLSSVILTVDSDNPFGGFLRFNTIGYANSYDKGYTLDEDCVQTCYSGLFIESEATEYSPAVEPLPAGTHYFLIPSGDGVIADHTPDTEGATKGFFLWINGNQMNTAPKTFTAGKVYTLKYPKIN